MFNVFFPLFQVSVTAKPAPVAQPSSPLVVSVVKGSFFVLYYLFSKKKREYLFAKFVVYVDQFYSTTKTADLSKTTKGAPSSSAKKELPQNSDFVNAAGVGRVEQLKQMISSGVDICSVDFKTGNCGECLIFVFFFFFL
jgi:hypothetical protein